MYTIRLPFFLRLPLRNLIWRLPQKQNTVYLTFDDGPIPEVTPLVLQILKAEGIKATFFCVAENVAKHPDVYQKVIDQGHRVGQHTYNHLPAFKHTNKAYRANIAKAKKWVNSDLFRPPHGQIRPAQLWSLRREYKIVLWDVLSADFDTTITPEQCLHNIKKYTRNGSIIVFHDSLKAQKTMLQTLPQAIAYLKEKGFVFEHL